MIKSITARTPFLALILFVFAIGYTSASNKVVVIPMGADAAPEIQWALVNFAGDIVSQSGGITVLSATHTGGTIINFGKDLRSRGIFATGRLEGNHISGLSISATICGAAGTEETSDCGAGYNSTNNLYVQTTSEDYTYARGAFYIAVLP